MDEKITAISLLSGGLDSVVNLGLAYEKGYHLPLNLTFHYGQSAALKEIDAASVICKRFGITHKTVTLPFFHEFSSSALTLMKSDKIPKGKGVDLNSLKRCQETAEAVWVPNRNGIFIEIAAGFAEMFFREQQVVLLLGFNAEEAITFADNTQEYVETINSALHFSTRGRVRVESFTLNFSKKEIAEEACRLGFKFGDFWPCYFGKDELCRECESCQRFLRAFHALGG